MPIDRYARNIIPVQNGDGDPVVPGHRLDKVLNRVVRFRSENVKKLIHNLKRNDNIGFFEHQCDLGQAGMPEAISAGNIRPMAKALGIPGSLIKG